MRARLWRHDIALRTPVSAADQVHSTRTHLFVELEIDGVYGYGEVSPQPQGLNGDPGLRDVVDEFEVFTLRQFIEAAQREGESPHWARVTHFAGSRPASRPASALLEMALLDRDLRARHATIEHQWPERFLTPTQATVSLLDEGPWVDVGDAAQVRAKISAHPVGVERWERLASLGRPVLLDFNCSGGSIDAVLATVERAQDFVDVVAVEQPFAVGNVVEHARLAAVLECPVSLDEGVRHRRDLDQIVRYQAARLVCIKPARVGGFAQARTMIERAQRLGLEVYLGGFFESPLARAANRALARHYLTRPSDIANADLATDLPWRSDPWGIGFVATAALTWCEPLVSRQW